MGNNTEVKKFIDMRIRLSYDYHKHTAEMLVSGKGY